MTCLPHDASKRNCRAVAIEPDVSVHDEAVRAVQSDPESGVQAAFDSNPAVRERATALLARRQLASAELQRKRVQAPGDAAPRPR